MYYERSLKAFENFGSRNFSSSIIEIALYNLITYFLVIIKIKFKIQSNLRHFRLIRSIEKSGYLKIFTVQSSTPPTLSVAIFIPDSYSHKPNQSNSSWLLVL